MMAVEQYQYEYLFDGNIKAYKKMTYQKAQDLNRELEKQGTCRCWVATTVGSSAQFGYDPELTEAA